MPAGASDAPDVARWIAAAREQLRVACALLERTAVGIGALEVLIDTGRGPQAGDWLMLRHLAADLARAHGVEVSATRLAHGVLFRVAPRRELHQSKPATDGGARWCHVRRMLPAGLLLASCLANL